jgi:hypothetical protein
MLLALYISGRRLKQELELTEAICAEILFQVVISLLRFAARGIAMDAYLWKKE